MPFTRRAALAGLGALALPRPAAARIYADTVSTVGESLDEIRAKGRLKVGVYADFAPFSSAGDAGLEGVDVAIAGLLAERLGLRLELVPVEAGETVEDDLRNHVWRGSLVDRSVVNLLLHVPYNRQLEIRSELAVLVQPYFTETFVVARDPAQLGEGDWLEGLVGQRIGVEIDSLPASYLGMVLGGRLQEGLIHYRRPEQALSALRRGEIAAFMGLRSQVEAGLGNEAQRFDLGTMPLPALGMSSWPIGAAVRENARDLGYAAGDILAAAVRDGTMRAIFAAHGISHAPPPFA